mgnify:CR=1 FL=1
MPYQETRIQVAVEPQKLEDTWRLAEASLRSIFPDRDRGLFKNDPDHNVSSICSFAMRPSGPRDIVRLRAIVSEFVDYSVIADLLESRGTHLLEVTTTHDPETGTRGISLGIYTYENLTHGAIRLLLEDADGEKSACIQLETGCNELHSPTRAMADSLQSGFTPQRFPLVELFGIY